MRLLDIDPTEFCFWCFIGGIGMTIGMVVVVMLVGYAVACLYNWFFYS